MRDPCSTLPGIYALHLNILEIPMSGAPAAHVRFVVRRVVIGSFVLLLSGTLGCGRAPSDASNSQAPGTPSTPPAAGGAGAVLFAIEEATIDSIHAAIRSGQTTCQAIVQAYIDRARAYNGVCTSLVTADGARRSHRPPATCARERR